MQNNNVVSGSQTGKMVVSPAKRELIEREVALHLGILGREFRSGVLNEDNGFNADETHLVIDQHNHKNLFIRGESDVNYAAVASGDDRMTMMILKAGGRNASVCSLFVLFRDVSWS